MKALSNSAAGSWVGGEGPDDDGLSRDRWTRGIWSLWDYFLRSLGVFWENVYTGNQGARI